MTVKERIKEFARTKGLSLAAFERKCGLSNAYFSGLKGEISPKKLLEIKRVFPDLNEEWVRTGEGSMRLPAQECAKIDVQNVKNFQIGENVSTTGSPTLIERLISIIESQQAAILNLTRKL